MQLSDRAGGNSSAVAVVEVAEADVAAAMRTLKPIRESAHCIPRDRLRSQE